MIRRLVGLVLLISGAALEAQEVTTATEAASRLRAGYWTGDYAAAAAAGKDYMARFPDALDVRAWTVASLCGSEMKKGVDAALALTREHPESPWSWFALTGPQYDLAREKEREAASEKMMALAAGALRDDFVIARALLLGERRERIPEALALLDARLPSAERRAAVLVAKAGLLLSQGPAQPGSLERALAVYAEAREADPADPAPYFLAGRTLATVRRAPEGLPLLRRAVELSPRTISYRRAYWRAITGLPDRTPEQKRQEVEADIEALLALRSDAPALLQVMLQYYDLQDDTRAAGYEARLLSGFPASAEAETALRLRPSRLGQRHGPKWSEDPALRKEAIAGWRAYLAYPHHSDAELVHQAWFSLLGLLRREPGTPDAEILQAVRGLDGVTQGRFGAYVLAASTLADRRLALDEAEGLARRALAELPAEIARAERFALEPKDAAEVTARFKAEAHDALGWVLLARGRRDEARRELLAAHEADPKFAKVLFHLGRLAEVAGAHAEAEGYYGRGKLLPTPDENPNDAALQALYQRRHGSLDGYEAYLAGLEEGDQAKRKKELLAERIASPEPLPAFTLKTLAGSTVSLADLEGKVVVINFWGVWCTWCLLEMGEVDALAKQYEGDPAVRVLTVSTDANPDTTRKWMAEKKYGFPVLLDDGWAAKSGVHGYPTTWFVDRQGRIAFKHTGWSKKLAEEFSWRIEALKEGAPTAGSAGR